jgi:proteasome lid subunit RPN8/RPN11
LSRRFDQRLVLTEAQIDQLEREAVAAYPEECCGILFGIERDGRRMITMLHPVENEYEKPQRSRRFSIAPRQLLDAENCAAERGERVIGYYHSHPDHPAIPSEFDRERAWPFYSYVIVSIERGRAREIRSWQLNEQDQQFEPQHVHFRKGKGDDDERELRESEHGGYHELGRRSHQ